MYGVSFIWTFWCKNKYLGTGCRNLMDTDYFLSSKDIECCSAQKSKQQLGISEMVNSTPKCSIKSVYDF